MTKKTTVSKKTAKLDDKALDKVQGGSAMECLQKLKESARVQQDADFDFYK